MAENGQIELEETAMLEDREAMANRDAEYQDQLKRYEANLKDLRNNVIQLDTDIETATGLSGMQFVLADQIKGYHRVESVLERVKFEKVSEAVEKSQSALIGILKQAHRLVGNKIEHMELNPPEPPA